MEWQLNPLWKNDVKLHGTKIITLILNKNKEMKHKTFDVDSGKQTFGIIPFIKNSSLEQYVEYFNSRVVTGFNKEGNPVFAKPVGIWHDVKSSTSIDKTYDVALFYFQNELLWQIYNVENKTYGRFPVELTTKLHESECLIDTINIFKETINSNNDKTAKERASFLEKYFTVECISPTPSAKRPWAIQLLPVSKPIDIDERVRISYFATAVYIIANGRGIKGNHAVIVMTGLNELLKKYTHTLEFFGNKVVMELNCPSPEYEERTKMHHVSSKKINELIVGMRNMPPEGLPKFHILGQNSIVGDKEKHNCITWALKIAKERLEIDFGHNDKAKTLFTYTKEFTKKEKKWQKLPVKKSLL